MVNWVTAGAAIVQASAAAVLVWFTIVSLRVSRQMVETAAAQVSTMKTQMQQTVLPVLALDVIDAQLSDANEDPRNGFRVILENVGLGPAIDVHIDVKLFREENLLSIYSVWQGIAIGAGVRVNAIEFRADASFVQLGVMFSQEAALKIAEIEVAYGDAYQRPGLTQGVIMYDATTHPGNNLARFATTAHRLPGGAVVKNQEPGASPAP